MFKKKNNVVCFILILVALVGGASIIFFDYNYSNSNTMSQQLSSQPYTDNYSNDQNNSTPFGNDERSLPQMTNTPVSNNYEISSGAKVLIFASAAVISFAALYLAMTKFSTQAVFVNNDKRIIYGLASCLLTVTIAFSCISATGQLSGKNKTTIPNNNSEQTTDEGII